eukprot:4441740-Karenia_brevis.AAC.1
MSLALMVDPGFIDIVFHYGHLGLIVNKLDFNAFTEDPNHFLAGGVAAHFCCCPPSLLQNTFSWRH